MAWLKAKPDLKWGSHMATTYIIKQDEKARKWKVPHGELYIIKDRCKGCGFCIEFCPKKVLVESKEFNAKGYHPPELQEDETKKCINCGFCSMICPEFAIFSVADAESKDVSVVPEKEYPIVESPKVPEIAGGRDVLTGEHFWNGDVAAAEGAIAAGCRFFAGYPITPSTEAAEHIAERIPQVGGVYVQMEDEIASIAAVLGAAWAGVKAMTATSGPGFSLMQENIGLAAMTETPCLIIDVQRGGPSTGLPTLVAQADVMQARWGTHGDHEIIALAPNSPQECFDLTIECFNLAYRYRTPVILLMDESVGHMTERVVVPDKSKIKLVDRKKPQEEPGKAKIYEAGDDLVPPMPYAGEGYNVHVTGLTHDERGYPSTIAETQERMIKRICDKIRKHRDEIVRVEEFMLEDAEIAVVAYGITSRVVKRAVLMAREKGIKAGMLRLITIWPFADKEIRALAKKVKKFLVVEINYGQIVLEVERCACPGEVHFLGKMGGAVHTPDEVLAKIEEVYK
jgi:2-oxoglutarate ferredoxin oxidoreductase subunit alpha